MVRLARRPSLWASLFLRIVFLIVAAFAVNVAMFFVAKRGTFFMLTLVVLIAIAALWELIRFGVWMRPGAPIVEIDHHPLTYGDSTEVRVTPTNCAEIGVTLVGDCSASASTDISEFRETKVARTRCYEQELLRMKPDCDKPIQPVVARVQIPKSPPADGMGWMIVVDSTLKNGDVIEHPYPIRVTETA